MTTPPLTIDSSTVERVSSTKFLGVHITEDLTWTTNTMSLSKKAQQRLHFLAPTLSCCLLNDKQQRNTTFSIRFTREGSSSPLWIAHNEFKPHAHFIFHYSEHYGRGWRPEGVSAISICLAVIVRICKAHLECK